MKWRDTKKLLHLLFWVIITLIFLYDRQYLLRKIGLGHFTACVVVRLGLIISLAYVNLYILIPRLFKSKRYFVYFSALIVVLCIYVSLQNLYDIYLYGFVIGAKYYRSFWYAFPFNLLTTSWYLLLTTAFKLSLDWYEQRKRITHLQFQIENGLTAVAEEEIIFLKSGTQNIRTNLAEITHIEGLKDYSVIFTKTAKIVVKGSLKAVGARLPAGRFIRIHKSYIIAKDKIQSMDTAKVTLVGGTVIPIGRNYKQQLEAQLKAEKY